MSDRLNVLNGITTAGDLDDVSMSLPLRLSLLDVDFMLGLEAVFPLPTGSEVELLLLLPDNEASIGMLVDLVPPPAPGVEEPPPKKRVGVGDLLIISELASSTLPSPLDEAVCEGEEVPLKCLDKYLAALEVGVVPPLPLVREETGEAARSLGELLTSCM